MIDSIFKEYYEVLYCSVSGDMNFELELNEKNSKLIQNFIKRFSKIYNYSIGKELIWDYLVFQFNYYSDQKTRFGNRLIKLNWVTGKKAVDRWLDKKDSYLYYNRLFLTKYNIVRLYTNQEEEGKKHYIRREKLRFFNTERGQIHCLEFGLYEKYSQECLVCKFKGECDEIFRSVK